MAPPRGDVKVAVISLATSAAVSLLVALLALPAAQKLVPASPPAAAGPSPPAAPSPTAAASPSPSEARPGRTSPATVILAFAPQPGTTTATPPAARPAPPSPAPSQPTATRTAARPSPSTLPPVAPSPQPDTSPTRPPCTITVDLRLVRVCVSSPALPPANSAWPG